MRRDYEEEKGIKTKISPYLNDQGQSMSYISRNNRRSRRSSINVESASGKLNSRSEPHRNGLDSHSSQIPVYGDERVEYGNMVTFDSQMRNVKNINESLREKNSEILRNLNDLREGIELKNKVKMKELKETYNNMTENNRTLLSSLRSRNNVYVR